jgi:hypothetical protein
MSEKFCCVTWETLNQELREAKEVELSEMQGVPKSVFAPVYRVLEKMYRFCPVCGTGLTEDAVKAPSPKILSGGSRTGKFEAEVPKKLRPKCAYCKGAGKIGEDKNGIDIKCARCLGQGYHDENTVNELTGPRMDPEKAQRLVELESELQDGKRGEVAE